MDVPSAPSNFLAQRFHKFDSKILGLTILSMKNGRRGFQEYLLDIPRLEESLHNQPRYKFNTNNNIRGTMCLIRRMNKTYPRNPRMPRRYCCPSGEAARTQQSCLQVKLLVLGWKINYPKIGYPEFCQLIEQENRDPNKALGQYNKSPWHCNLRFA